jgi:hypothetical protein
LVGEDQVQEQFDPGVEAFKVRYTPECLGEVAREHDDVGAVRWNRATACLDAVRRDEVQVDVVQPGHAPHRRAAAARGHAGWIRPFP